MHSFRWESRSLYAMSNHLRKTQKKTECYWTLIMKTKTRSEVTKQESGITQHHKYHTSWFIIWAFLNTFNISTHAYMTVCLCVFIWFLYIYTYTSRYIKKSQMQNIVWNIFCTQMFFITLPLLITRYSVIIQLSEKAVQSLLNY